MTLKEQIENDLPTFVNSDEFADDHTIDGVAVKCVVDSDIVKERNRDSYLFGEGTYAADLVLYVKSADLLARPVRDQVLNFDNTYYMCVEVSEDMGMLEISLRRHGQ